MIKNETMIRSTAITANYEIGEQKLKDFIKNGAGTTPRHNNQENTENDY